MDEHASHYNFDKCRTLLNLSLIKIANTAYKEAYECLAEAYTLMPDNSLVRVNFFCIDFDDKSVLN